MAVAKQDDFYADPLIYDVLHAPGTGDEVDALLAVARKHLPRCVHGGVRFFEPACGTGRFLIDLARKGHVGVGLDLSEPMIAFANQRAALLPPGRRARFFVGDMTRFRLDEPADAAFCTINSIRHLMTDRHMLAHLACTARALKPGGVYIVGIETAEPAFAQPSEDVWMGRRRTATTSIRVKQVVQYLPPAVSPKSGKPRPGARAEQVISTMVINQDGQERQIDSTYVLRTYTHAQWLALIAKAGWRVEAIYNAEGVPRPEATLGYYLWVISPAAGARDTRRARQPKSPSVK